MEGLVVGRIVYYVFNEQTAEAVNRRRTNSRSIAERMAKPLPEWPYGAQAHVGNEVHAGDVAPAMVVGINGPTNVNLKVMLDGSDEFWATSVAFSESKDRGQWHWMFTGQDKRYTPTQHEAVVLEPVVAPAEPSGPVEPATPDMGQTF